MDFLWVEVNSFGCYKESKEFATGYPHEGLGWVHFQLMLPPNVEYSPQICNMIIFGTAFYCNIVYVALYSLAYILMEDYIHCLLICRSCVLQAKGHHGVAIHSQWCSKRCMLFIFRVHLDLIIS